MGYVLSSMAVSSSGSNESTIRMVWLKRLILPSFQAYLKLRFSYIPKFQFTFFNLKPLFLDKSQSMLKWSVTHTCTIAGPENSAYELASGSISTAYSDAHTITINLLYRVDYQWLKDMWWLMCIMASSDNNNSAKTLWPRLAGLVASGPYLVSKTIPEQKRFLAFRPTQLVHPYSYACVDQHVEPNLSDLVPIRQLSHWLQLAAMTLVEICYTMYSLGINTR